MSGTRTPSRPGASGTALLELVDASPLPVAVVELPGSVIRAISGSALEIIGQDRSIIGQTVDDITSDVATGGLDLVHDGRLSGYETTRVFTGSHGDRTVRLWVRALSDDPPVELALTVLVEPDELRAGLHLLDGDPAEVGPVVGTVDRTLAVDRVSAEVEQVLGLPAADVLRRSVLDLFTEEDAGSLLLALAETSATGHGACVAVSLKRPGREPLPSALSLLPLQPGPSFAFALTERPAPARAGAQTVSGVVTSICRAIESTDATRALAARSRTAPGLERLTSRELLVVGRLMDGDRVPAIAGALFLSQSTVRNHLSSVFRKLGVSSQQELIHLLRSGSDASSTG